MENQQNMIVAEVQLIYKTKVKATDRPKITKAEDAYKVLQNHWNYEVIDFLEQFKIMLLNRANKVLGIIDISFGGISGTFVDLRVIFAAAIKGAASSVILIHNHPSGNLTPSVADRQMTRKIQAVGEIMEIKVLDHIILTRDGFYSFADQGMM